MSGGNVRGKYQKEMSGGNVRRKCPGEMSEGNVRRKCQDTNVVQCFNVDVVDLEADPKLLLTITGKTEEKSNEGIYALAVLANEIFIIARMSSEVEVYNRTDLQFQRNVSVDNLQEPRDIASCYRNNCLYIIDGNPIDQPMEILKVDKDGNILKKIWQGNDWGRLSVTSESNLILTVLDKRQLLEITPDGQLVLEIALDVSHPWHAVKLTSDRFMVAYNRYSVGGICMVDNKGKVLMSSSEEALCISDSLLINLAVNRDGSLLAVDENAGRIILLTPTLEFRRKFIPEKNGLKRPRRLFVDEPNGRLLVCDNSQHVGRILVFDIAG